MVIVYNRKYKMTLNNFLLKNSSSVTNTKLVCKDGIISSHKILVASTSEFIKNIMRDIPCNDDITLILPDFTENEVFNLLSKVFTENNSKQVQVDPFYINNSENVLVNENENISSPNLKMKVEETIMVCIHKGIFLEREICNISLRGGFAPERDILYQYIEGLPEVYW